MRTIRLILVSLCLGAVTTVGVACAAFVDAKYRDRTRTQWTYNNELVFHEGVHVGYMSRSFWGGTTSTMDPFPGEPPRRWHGPLDHPDHTITLDRVPEHMTNAWRDAPGRYVFVVEYGFPRRSVYFVGGPDPLRFVPLPLGFTIDTAFYGAIWFGMLVSPGFVRRRIRKRRGLCPSCGYDLRGSDGVCSECGATRKASA